MRSDKGLEKDFRESRDWNFELGEFGLSMTTVLGMVADDLPEAKRVSHSFSGHERNHLFRSERGSRFDDISLISGLDHPGDSRGFSLLDFDRDGFPDIAMINANRPTFQLYRNQLGDLGSPARSIAVRVVGGNQTASESAFANRDGYGAVVRVRGAGQNLMREHRGGDGFSAQNSDTLVIGVGVATSVDVSVTWPSGAVTEVSAISPGSLVTAYEDPAVAAALGGAMIVSKYGPPVQLPAREASVMDDAEQLDWIEKGDTPVLLITFATWCEACLRYLPHERLLHEQLLDGELRMFGLPVDPKDTEDKLVEWTERFNPPHGRIAIPNDEAAAQVQRLLQERLGATPLPSSILTDGSGQVVAVWAGVPTLSELRRRLERLDPDER